MPDIQEQTSNYSEEEKLLLIKKENARLTKLYKNLGPDRLKANKGLIANAAFMSITLDDLKMSINKKGVVSTYQNGENQWGTKKSPEVETYNSMIKLFSGIIKQLDDALPKVTVTEDDGFDNFIENRED